MPRTISNHTPPFALSSGTPDSTTPPLTVLSLLQCLRRRWKQTLALGSLLAVGLAAMVWVFLPASKPYAVAKLYFPSGARGFTIDRPNDELNQATQRELILSRLVLDPVLQMPEVAELPTIQAMGNAKRWLSKELLIDFPSGSEIVRLTLNGDNPEDLKILVDAIKDTYMKTIANRFSEERNARIKTQEQKLQEAREELAKIELDIATRTKAAYAVDRQMLTLQQKNTLEILTDQQKELSRIQNELLALENEESALRERNPERLQISPQLIEDAMKTDPALVDVQKRLSELLAKYTYEKGKNPAADMSIEENQIKSLQKKEGELRKTIRPRVEKMVREQAIIDGQNRLVGLRDDIYRLKNREKAQKEIVDKLLTQSATLNAASYTVGGSELQILQVQAKVAARESALEKMQMEYTPLRVQALEDAVAVRPDDASRRFRLALIAAILGFGFVATVMSFLEFRAGRLSSLEDLQQIGLPVVGTVPNPKFNWISGLLPGNKPVVQWDSVIHDAMDSTRTLFLHMADLSNIRVALVTSALGREGKTSVAYRLAISLAKTGRRTLLIDGDLRDPSLYKLFSTPVSPGVCDVLRDQVSVREAIQPTSIANLHLLNAGQCDRLALEQLAQDGFAQMMIELRQQFDYILIDSSPILPVADALLMARCVDGVLLALLRDVSQMDRVNSAYQRLLALNVPVLGAIMNGTKAETYGYGKYPNRPLVLTPS